MAEVRLHQVRVDVPSGEQARRSSAVPEAAASASSGPLAPATDLTLAERDLLAAGRPPVGPRGAAPPVLDYLSLVVRDGETVSVVGPSGCGKTTLLRVVAGLQPVKEGTVWIGGRDVTAEPPADRGIGMVFQTYALYPHMEGRGNLGFFFKLRHRAAEIDDRVREVAQILGVGFEELLDRRPGQLSGGQQQRVAIGRCIIRDPSVFLFDEPLSNLDARLRESTRVEIKRLLRRFAISALYVTHDQTEALALGDRIAVMRRGRLEQVGTYRELHERPSSLFVATFLGSPPCNVLRGTVEHGDVMVAGAVLPGVPAARVHRGLALVGIRPEDLALAAEAGPETLQARVERLERLPSGHSMTVTLQLAGRAAAVRLSRDVDIAPGDAVALAVDPLRVLLFDADDGRLLSA